MYIIVGGERLWSRAIALALIAVGIAGCSGDSTRFNDSPFPERQYDNAGPVAATPLPPPQDGYGATQNGYGGNYNAGPNNGYGGSYNNGGNYNNGNGGNYNGGYNTNQNGGYPPSGGYPSNGNYYQNQSAAPAVSGGARTMVSYAPANASPSYAPNASAEYTGSVNAPPRPAAPIAAAPPIAAPRSLAPPAPIPAPTAAPVRTPAPVPGATVHVIAQGDTFYNISRRYGRSVNEIAKANNMEQTTPLRIGARLTIPGTQTAQALPATTAAPKTAAKPAQSLGGPTKLASASSTPATVPSTATPSAKPAATAAKPAGKQQVAESTSAANASVGATASASANVMTPVPDGPTLSGSSKPTGEGTPSFRWPVRGRVIEGFGAKANGQQNDGINLAVPEGTPVKAAEDGTVAYAGNELKGYGNLLLVRHSNGYVTAYAHSKELLVKRGEEVKRGQVIAKSGQTGNVDAPQLHFEVRKGQAPLNPMPLLKADNGAGQ